MPYMREKCVAGETAEYRYYYTYRYNNRGGVRNRKELPTSDSQRNINRMMAVRECTRAMNANFVPGDLYVTFTYRKEERPLSAEVMKRQIKTLLDKLRRYVKKKNIPLRYIWTAEVGKRGAVHIHMVLTNAISVKELQRAWAYGFIKVIPLDDSGQYKKLAEYFVKYSIKTEESIGHPVGHRYNPSRNLRRPKVEKKAITGRRKIPDTIPVPNGWYLDKETVRRGINSSGYEYLSYTLIRITPRGAPERRKNGT